MIPYSVMTASKADESSIVDVLTLAFSTDPIMRWAYENPRDYLRNSADLFRIFAANAFTNAAAYYLDKFMGAALWLPPGVTFDSDAIGLFMQRTVAEQVRGDLFSLFDQVVRYHPKDPHWYLVVIGVDPACQNQ